MRSPFGALAIAASIVFSIPVCAFGPEGAPASRATLDADVVVTAAPVYLPLAALRGEERFPKGAQLQLIHQGKAEPLVEGFAASADASVAPDAKTILFAGKRNAGDPWQIWELTLAGRSVRRVLTTETDAIRPLYLPGLLPGGRLVYAHRGPHGFQLESARVREIPAATAAYPESGHISDPAKVEPGPSVVQLTYLPASAVPADVLQDGRILFESGYPLGAGATPEMYLVYADGSGVESYRCDHPATPSAARWGGRQLASGDVVFTHGASLARFASPLAHEERIVAPRAEYAGGIVETASGAWLASARSSAGAHYALKLWEPGSAALQTVLALNGEDLVEPVLAAEHARPKRHPSGLHDWDYANMMALDARESREGTLKAAPRSVRLETLDAAGHAIATGTARVEADGSFFVKTPADKPIRFVLLDEKGTVLRQERGWFWIRRGEQRICVGCHTGPERASENRVPMVLMRTTTPTDLTGAGQAGVQPQKMQEGK
jgi:hypothetical protein